MAVSLPPSIMNDDFTFLKDIRSMSVPTKRTQKAKQKYYSYRSNHPSTVGQPYVALAGKRPEHTNPFLIDRVVLGDRTCIEIWTKRDLWLDRTTDIWPLRPPHHFGRCRRCHSGRPGEPWTGRKREAAAFKREYSDVDDALNEAYHSCPGCAREGELRWAWLVEESPELEYESSGTTIGSLMAVDDREVGCPENEGEVSASTWMLSLGSLAQDLGFELVEVDCEVLSDSDSWSTVDYPV